jgi:putative membrane protein
MRLLAAASLIATLGVMPAWSQAPNPAGTTPGTSESAPGKPAPNQPNQPDRTFIRAAAMGGHGEVELGQLAEKQGQNSAVQNFARRMVQDHGKANEQLAHLAQAAHVPAPSTPDADSQAMRAELASLQDGAFDRAYIRGQIAAHQVTAQLLAYEIGSGQDPQLQKFAEETLPVVLHHLALAQDIDAQLTGAAAPIAALAAASPQAPAAQAPTGGNNNRTVR